METITDKKIFTGFRLKESLIQDLKRLATGSNRSLNNYVETLLTKFVDAEKDEATALSKEELIEKVARSEKETKDGEGIVIRNKEELEKFLNEL
ncbi:MAG: toxin-antitoxin system protein [Paludibacteraceae bacterium]|nr:toxin-antitoxin system protein [Paludibacteraceae bacterium]